jgi:tetratricopeptide (TPR) repeat protein
MVCSAFKIVTGMSTRIFAVTCFVLLSISAAAQVDFNKHFSNGKQLFREGKYNLAMEAFKPAMAYDKANLFAEYANFYYAVSAYNMGYKAVAKDQLNSIKSVYPSWNKIDEVNLWLAKIHLDNKDYNQGFKTYEEIRDKSLQKDIDAAKTQALADVTSVVTLKQLRDKYPKDEVVGRALARELAKTPNDPAATAQLESLIRTFNFKRSDFIAEAPRTVLKDKYSISLIMPFMVRTLEPTPVKKRNQIVLDFYDGVKLAIDTLNSSRNQFSLRAYDSERDNTKIKSVLATEELKNTDLVIGPFFQEESKPLIEFALTNRTNVINPFANNSELIANNPYSYLFQPSVETLGKESGNFLAGYTTKKTCLVFHGATRRDSLLAKSFIATATEKGLQVVASVGVPRGTEKEILTMLTTGTEFDEFKNPIEFSLKKDSIGSIFVASDDPLIFAKVISSIETRGDKVVVLGSEAWLDQSIVDFEKYQTLPIVLAAPNFADMKDPDYRAFLKKYIKVHARVPSQHARMGYELMMFFGNQLRGNGIYFQEALNRQNYFPGTFYPGFNFQTNRNNQFIPFIRYENDGLKPIKKP